MRTSATLVGRNAETAWLLARLDEALAGRPQVVLVEGEAGVGKTRLVRELQVAAGDRGAEVCTGRCREHLSLPYLAVVDSLLPRLQRFAADDDELSDYAHLIGRLLGRSSTARPADAWGGPTPEQEQMWLFLAVARSVVRLAQHRPLVVAIDDLHWADRPSLDLLTHVVLQVADAALGEAVPLLLVATLRAEVDPRLDEELARLRREPVCHHLALTGLSEAETRDLLESLGHHRPSRRLVAAAHEATAGNPLLLENVADQLSRPGALEVQGRELVPSVPLLVPEELNAAVADRIDALSAAGREILVAAAFLGDRLDVTDIAAVAPDVDAATAIEEVVAAGLLVHRAEDGALQFAHPVYGRVVRSRSGAESREQLHLAMADRIEALPATERDRRALELARHLIGAGSRAAPERVLEATRSAAGRAWAMFAWPDAAQSYEAAARAAAALGHPEAEIAALEYDAGRARYRSMETGTARVWFEQAAARFATAGDRRGVALARSELARSDLHDAAFGAVVDINHLEAVLGELRSEDPDLCGRLLAQLADLTWVRGDLEKAESFARDALALTGAAPATVQARVALAIIDWLRLDLRRAAEHLAEAHTSAETADDPWLWGHVLPREAFTRTWLGDLDGAEQCARRAVAVTREVGDLSECSLALAAQVGVAVARGDATTAEASAADAWNAARIARYDWGASFFLPTLAGMRVAVGADVAAEAALDQWGRAAWTESSLYEDAMWLTRQWIRAHAGHVVEARRALEGRPDMTEARWWAGIGAIARFATLVELSDLTGIEIARHRAERALAGAADAGMQLTEGPVLQVARVRGVLARLDGRIDDAVALLDGALAEGIALGLGPELARTRLDLARALQARGATGDSARAATLATEASRSFDGFGMRRSAATAERLAGATAPIDLPDTDAVLLLTDVVESTALTERWGDEVYRRRANELDRNVRRSVATSGGRAVEGITLGDGLLAVFTTPADALECAISTHRHAAEVGLALHVGLHVGAVREEGGAIYGGAVNFAARVCAAAEPGETLVSEALRSLLVTSGVVFDDRGLHRLKGIAEPQPLYAVRTDH